MDKSTNSQLNKSKNSRLIDEKNFHQSLSKFGNNSTNSLDVNKTVYHFKIILLGNISVGKTCILGRFYGNSYSSVYKCSISVDFRIKTLQIDESSVADLKIWDTCGDEKFHGITMQYYRESNGVVLVFDITNRDSFTKLGEWVVDLKTSAPPDVIIMVVGNKADLEAKRTVSTKEINDYVSSQSFEYIEVSAKTGMNIQLLFEKLSNMMIKNQTQKNSTNNSNTNVSNTKKSNQINNNYESTMSDRKSLKMMDNKEKHKTSCC